MDKYLTMFTDQFDKEFKPESLFPNRKFSIRNWLYRKFNISKYQKKLPGRNFLEFKNPANTNNYTPNTKNVFNYPS